MASHAHTRNKPSMTRVASRWKAGSGTRRYLS